ncbi:MAG: hypothetical protein Q4D73_07005 [Actinomycetaceae bacterium]|nr:hypothetical protein [Actinomycetaceae bacterium]
MKPRKTWSAFTILALSAALAGCSAVTTDVEAFDPDTPSVSTESKDIVPEHAEGPLAQADRPLAERTISETDTTVTVDIDFGNTTTDKQFTAALRGQLVVPKPGTEAAKKFAETGSPLIVISHLRSPNCLDGTFAFPCKTGVQEIRSDRGMNYYAQFLAEQGYTVIVPDLGGIFVGVDVKFPYDQHAMWKESVEKFVTGLKSDGAGKTQIFGVDKLGKIDFSKVGLLLHSRSGSVVEPAQEVFGKASVKTVLAYGPSYDTFELSEISAAPADIPYLAIVGEDDADVGASANLWLGHYLPQKRQHPAAVVSVPGLGHMFINQAAVDAGADDRIGCEERSCPDAAEHQRVLKEVGLDWFNATLTGADTKLPLTATTALPDQVAGLPARWLAYTPQPLLSVGADQFKGASEKTLQLCINPDPMNPTPVSNACPEPESGLVQILTKVAYLTDASAEVEVKDAKGIALHLAPAGTMSGEGAELKVVLTLADGTSHTLEVPPTHSALKNRSTSDFNGVYQLTTIRLELPAEVSGGVIKKIQLLAPTHPVEFKSVDFF